MLRRTLIVLHLAIGVSAVASGQRLMRDPTGASMQLESAWLEGSPFADYRVPGLFLGVALAGTNLLSAMALARGASWAPGASAGTGGLLSAWVAIQT